MLIGVAGLGSSTLRALVTPNKLGRLVRRAFLIVLYAALMIVLRSSPVAAYDFEVSARSEAYAYQLRRFSRDGIVVTNRRRFTQYLGFRLYDLLQWNRKDRGSAPLLSDSKANPARMYTVFLMRFFSDFGDYATPSPTLGGSVRELRDNRLELLFGSIEGRNLWGVFDFSLGRQVEMQLFDFFAYDGLRVRLNLIGNIFVEGKAGVQVDRVRPLGTAVFELDGTTEDDASDDPLTPTFGAAIGIDGADRYQIQLAYRSVISKADVTSQGVKVETPAEWAFDQEVLFLAGELQLRPLEARVSGAMRYNILASQLDELQVQWNQQIVVGHRIAFEALRSQPHFDGDSIFNLFAQEAFNELALQYRGAVARELRLQIRVGYRWLPIADAERDLGNTSTSKSLALSAILALHRRRYRGEVGAYYLTGLGGQRLVGDIGGSWTSSRWIFGRRISFEGRASLVHLVQDDRHRTQLTTFGTQLGARVRLLPQVRLHLLAENNTSRLFAMNTRILAVLSMRFKP